MGRLIPLWEELRSYLAIVALLAIGLPAVVLVLTLLADSSRPFPEPISDGVKGGEVAHHQSRPSIDGRGGNGTVSVRPLGRNGESGSPEGSSEADGASPTRQPVRDHNVAGRGQDPLNDSVDTPATSTATASAAPTTAPAEPVPVGPSTPPAATAAAPSTAPATTSSAASTAMATASPEAAVASESSPPATFVPISEPVEVPVDGVRGVDFGEHLYDPVE